VPVGNGDIARVDLRGEDIDDARISQQQIGRRVTSRDAQQVFWFSRSISGMANARMESPLHCFIELWIDGGFSGPGFDSAGDFGAGFDEDSAALVDGVAADHAAVDDLGAAFDGEVAGPTA
jgi:hypothetical protein